MLVYFMKTCDCGFYVKCNFSEVGVGQILNMEVHDFRAVVKHGVKSWWVPMKYMKSWVAHGGRTVLNTQQLKLGLGSSDAPGPTGVRSSKSATTNKNIDAVHDMVMSVGRVTLLQIVDTILQWSGRTEQLENPSKLRFLSICFVWYKPINIKNIFWSHCY